MNELRAVAAAFTFMTRLPLGRFASHDENHLRASAAYFPLVGVTVGAIGASVYVASKSLWPTSIAVLLSMIATVFATGAFHEDALADTLDGFGGGRTPDRILEIMKDSRVGSFALVGVALTLAVKFAALVSIGESGGVSRIARTLVAGHVLARWSSIPLMMTLPYVRPTSTNARPSAGGPFATPLHPGRAFTGSAIAAVLSFAVLGASSIVAGIVAIVVTLIAGLWFKRRIGGITGDTLGAANQIVEVAVYLAILARP